MSGYTKGPWNRSSLASLYIIPGDDSNPICSMGEYSKRGRVETTFENAQANARLIVAAPELLEALKETLVSFGTRIENVDWLDYMREVIAKAEGAK